jgi:dsDNA-specific endonuclease/ATPase MutS2
MKMYDKDFDPLTALQQVIEQNRLQAQQIAELQHYLEEASKLLKQHSHLIKQLTEQNTQILLMWANTPNNFADK